MYQLVLKWVGFLGVPSHNHKHEEEIVKSVQSMNQVPYQNPSPFVHLTLQVPRMLIKSTTFLSMLWAHCTQSVPRQVVDLENFPLWRATYLDYVACWYLNESSFHGKFEYIIIKLIHGSTGLLLFGTVKVKSSQMFAMFNLKIDVRQDSGAVNVWYLMGYNGKKNYLLS